MRYQSLNEYRKRFMLKPFRSFEELTGNSPHPSQQMRRCLQMPTESCSVIAGLEQDSLAQKMGFFHLQFLLVAGEKEMAAELEELYGDIDAMELYPGLLVEKPRPGAIFGETMVEIGAPFSLKGLMGNAICSPEYWKPSTFGGKVGFDIVNTASLQKLICNNVKGCPFTAFHILPPEPTEATINVSTSKTAMEDINPTLLLKERSAEL